MRSYLQLLFVAVFTVAVAGPAWGVPAKFTQQGRLLDISGQPLTGTHALFFVLYDASTGGVEQWSEYHSAPFDSGYYSVTLGEVTPLDDLMFSGGPLWLELAVDGVALEPRQEVASVPWALRAISAEHLDGGVVDAATISIDGTEVINSTGTWVGPTPSVDWTELSGMPPDIVDGDQDTQLTETDVDAMVANNDYSTGAHTTDTNTQLTEAEVDAFVANNDYSTGTHTTDTLATLLCAQGQVAKWNSGTWECADDADTVTTTLPWTALTAIPPDIDDGDQDTDTLGDLSLLCLDGDRAAWDATQSQWVCTPSQVNLTQIDTTGAAAEQVLTFDGFNVGWQDNLGSQWTDNGGTAISYAGEVGIGTASPQATLDVNGGIKIADDLADCTANKAGTMRWHGQTVEICNGSSWTAIYSPPPSLESVSPDSGYTTGGYTMTLTGLDFVSSAIVTIGGVEATNVTVLDANTCTATVPFSSTVGARNVTLTNPDGRFSTIQSGFTYIETPYATVTFTENQGVTLTDYAVRVDISAHGTALSGGFLIADPDGNSVDYCFEVQGGDREGECTSSYTGFIWVKLSSLPSSGTFVLSIFPGASTAQTGLDVFEVYEDFEDNNTAPGISGWSYNYLGAGYIGMAGSDSYYVGLNGSGLTSSVHKKIDYYQGTWLNESDLTLWLDGNNYGGDIDVYNCPIRPSGARSWTIIKTDEMSYSLCGSSEGPATGTFSPSVGSSFEYRHRSNDTDASGMTLNWISMRPYVDNEPSAVVSPL